jgi:hypothetical protein
MNRKAYDYDNASKTLIQWIKYEQLVKEMIPTARCRSYRGGSSVSGKPRYFWIVWAGYCALTIEDVKLSKERYDYYTAWKSAYLELKKKSGEPI